MLNTTDYSTFRSERVVFIKDNRYSSKGQTSKSFWKWVAEKRKSPKTTPDNDKRTVVMVSSEELTF